MAKLKRFYLANQCYFLTTTAYRRRKLFVPDAINHVVIEGLDFCRKILDFKLLGYVIMPDHLHLLLLPEGEANITRIMHSFKSYTGRSIKRLLLLDTPVWQHRFYDHIIRDDADFWTRLGYMHGNPAKHCLIEHVEDYRWSSWANYFRDDHSVIRIDTGFAPPRLEAVATGYELGSRPSTLG